MKVVLCYQLMRKIHVFAYVQYALLLAWSGYGSQQNTLSESQVIVPEILLTAFTEYSPPWEVNSSSASQFPALYETQKYITVFPTFRYLAYAGSSPRAPMLFFSIYFSIILPARFGLPSGVLIGFPANT
jgi:hypothetical protein